MLLQCEQLQLHKIIINLITKHMLCIIPLNILVNRRYIQEVSSVLKRSRDKTRRQLEIETK